MSTIYEALRKAEERRRLGEAPSLIGDAAWAARKPARAHESRRRWLVWLLPVVVAALAGAWWLGRGSAPAPGLPPAPAPVAASPTPPPAAATPVAPAAAPAASAPAVAPASAPAAVVTAPVAAPPPVQRPAVVEPAAAAVQGPAPGSATAAPSVVSTAIAPASPPAATAPAVTSAQPLATAAPRPDAATPAPSAPATAVPAAPPFGTLPPTSAALAPPAAVASTLVPTQSPGVPLLYEMPLGTRQALPPLKLSMHVYSPDPARRVVIIDGARLLEGEIVSGELKVSQITSEGVVLQLGDQVFLLPRGGR